MAQTVKQARRESVKGYPGVFKRPNTRPAIYEFWYFDSHGKRRWKTAECVGDLKSAVQERADLMGKVSKGELVAPTKQTFSEYANEWLESKTKIRDTTRDGYQHTIESHLRPSLGRVKMSDLTENHVARMVADLEARGFQPGTIRNTLNVLSGMLKTGVRRGVISRNVVSNLSPDERPGRVDGRKLELLNAEQVQKVIDVAGNHRPMVELAVQTGLRAGEILGLEWRDIDWDEQVIRVRRQLNPLGVVGPVKTESSERDVVLPAGLARTLKLHRIASPASLETDPVFVTKDGTRLGRSWMMKITQILSRRAGFNIRWHDLRHAYASYMISNGVDIIFVSNQLGHKTADITLKVYTHVYNRARHQERAREVLSEAFG